MWLLTTALLAVLSTNYAFQTSSKDLILLGSNTAINYGSYELASTAQPLQPASAQVSTQGSLSSSSPVSATAQATRQARGSSEQRATTQAVVLNEASCPQGQCREVPAGASVLVKLEDYQKLLARITELEKKSTDSVQPLQPVSAVSSSLVSKPATATEDCKALTDRREQRDCERQAREDAKQERLQAKRDKEDAALEARKERFEDRAYKIQDKCDKDLECLSREFSSELRRYTGRNALPASFITQQFKAVVGGALSKALFNAEANPEVTAQVLSQIFSDMPAEYRSVQQAALDGIRSQAAAKALVVNQNYKLAAQVSKQNNPQAYLQIMGQAQQEHNELSQMADMYSSVAAKSEAMSDASFYRYYNANYLPQMNTVFSKIMSIDTTQATQKVTQAPTVSMFDQADATTPAQETTQRVQTTRQNARVGRPSFSPNQGLVQPQLAPQNQLAAPAPSRGRQ